MTVHTPVSRRLNDLAILWETVVVLPGILPATTRRALAKVRIVPEVAGHAVGVITVQKILISDTASCRHRPGSSIVPRARSNISGRNDRSRNDAQQPDRLDAELLIQKYSKRSPPAEKEQEEKARPSAAVPLEVSADRLRSL